MVTSEWPAVTHLRDREASVVVGPLRSIGSPTLNIALGDLDAAAELYPLIRWCAERTGNVFLIQPDCRLLERGAGMAAAAGSNWDVAEAHFLTALGQAEQLPHRPEQANTRRYYGAMLLRRGSPGDADRAGQLLAESEALYRAMGMPRHVELTRAIPGR